MLTDAGQPELATAGQETFLRLEQHAQARARDVLEPAAVERHGSLDFVQKGLCGRRLRGVQASRNDHNPWSAIVNREHWFPLCQRSRDPTVPRMSSGT